MIPGGQSLEVVATGLVVESENIGPLKHKYNSLFLLDQQISRHEDCLPLK